MIDNFEEVKRQLKELSDVINGYKSEAVQLRIVELVLGQVDRQEEEMASSQEGEGQLPPKVRKKRKKKQSAAAAASSTEVGGGAPVKKARASKGRPSGKATLEKLLGDGFFKKPRAIADLVSHADTNMALQYKQSDFSGPLGRAVRDGKLKRTKNANGQYEYTNV